MPRAAPAGRGEAARPRESPRPWVPGSLPAGSGTASGRGRGSPGGGRGCDPSGEGRAGARLRGRGRPGGGGGVVRGGVTSRGRPNGPAGRGAALPCPGGRGLAVPGPRRPWAASPHGLPCPEGSRAALSSPWEPRGPQRRVGGFSPAGREHGGPGRGSAAAEEMDPAPRGAPRPEVSGPLLRGAAEVRIGRDERVARCPWWGPGSSASSLPSGVRASRGAALAGGRGRRGGRRCSASLSPAEGSSIEERHINGVVNG